MYFSCLLYEASCKIVMLHGVGYGVRNKYIVQSLILRVLCKYTILFWMVLVYACLLILLVQDRGQW